MKNNFRETTYPCHVPDRSLNNQILFFDLPEITGRVKNEDAWKKGDRNAITLLKSSSMRIVLIALKDLAEINFRHSGNFISIQVLDGTAHFKMENKAVILPKGSLVTLHDDIGHTLIAMEESVILLSIAICPPGQTASL
jgi:quercetin dioxygenase-like cupin family protein